MILPLFAHHADSVQNVQIQYQMNQAIQSISIDLFQFTPFSPCCSSWHFSVLRLSELSSQPSPHPIVPSTVMSSSSVAIHIAASSGKRLYFDMPAEIKHMIVDAISQRDIDDILSFSAVNHECFSFMRPYLIAEAQRGKYCHKYEDTKWMGYMDFLRPYLGECEAMVWESNAPERPDCGHCPGRYRTILGRHLRRIE